MVRNVHERSFHCSISKVGALIDSLGSEQDRLWWPHDRWPPMRFDRPLAVGAVGQRGPIREVVEAYEPERRIRFRILVPRGFMGTHGFEVEEISPGVMRLRHVLNIQLRGRGWLTWLLVIRWLHDALLEDIMDGAQAYLTSRPVNQRRWSLWVRWLRWLLRTGRR